MQRAWIRGSAVRKRAVGMWLAVASLFWGAVAQANWQLEPSRSQVQATITQLGAGAPEAHRYQLRDLQGEISPDGTLRLPLRLSQTDILDQFGTLPTWVSLLANTTLVTLTAQMPPARLDALDVGESLVETLTFRVQMDGVNQQEPVPLRFTREGLNEVRVTHAEPMALDGRTLMANSTVRTLLNMLGFQEIGNEVPVTLNALLINR